jgi:hypothetical protein
VIFTVGADGSLFQTGTVAAGNAPEGIAITPNGQNLYVTNIDDGTVSQFTINADGSLTPKSPPTVATGITPRGIAVHPNGLSAYVTNALVSIVPGSISQYDINPDGTLSPKTPPSIDIDDSTTRGIVVSPDGNSVYAADYDDHAGGPGGVLQFDVAANGTLTEKTPPSVAAGDSPIELAMSSNGGSLYASNVDSGDVSQFDVGAGGLLAPKATPLIAAGSGPYQIALVVPPTPDEDNPLCRGKESTIVGTSKPDKLTGTAGDDVIVGLGGRDKIKGLKGDDRICGGKKGDKLGGGGGDDFLAGQRGPDNVSGGKGDDEIFGDRLGGGKKPHMGGKDTIKGGAGKDDCNGGGAKDKASGCEAERKIP